MDLRDFEGKLNTKDFGTDLSAIVATYIHWHLPDVGSSVAVISSTSCGADLPGSQS